MKITVIYQGSIYAAWSVSDGIPRTLKKMGHEVLDFPEGRPGRANWWDRLPDVNQSDLVLFSGPEHSCRQPGIPNFCEAMKTITVPKFALYHESMLRQDQNFPFPELLDTFDHHFYPAAQDAEVLDNRAKGRCHFLPFGVDTDVFRQMPCPECKGEGGRRGMITGPAGKMAGMELCKICQGSGIDNSMKTIPFGFIGMIYAKRKVFMDKVRELYDIPLELVCGGVQVMDIEGINPLMTVHRLAWNYNRILCFVNLPSLSQLLVTKITETMACGCCLLTPKLEGAGARNMKGFQHGKTLLYYPENPKDMLAMMRGVFKNPDMAKTISRDAAKFIKENHSLKSRLEQVLLKFQAPGENLLV